MDEQAVFEALKYRIEVDEDGTRRYFNTAGQFHRIGGPAVEYADGSKAWWQKGLRHRTDGAAVEHANGTKAWFQNGLRHRTGGPAIEYASGRKMWYINGEELSEAEFNQAVNQKQNV